MKGGLCCALFALKAVRDAGVRLRGRLSVASVVGEEDGGTGTLATILRGHTADGAVVVEPTRTARGPGAGRLPDVPPRRARALRARLRARGGRQRRREVRAAARGAAAARGRALRGGRRPGTPAPTGLPRPLPATRGRRSSPATVCRGPSRSARCAPATGRAASPIRSWRRDATASPSARTSAAAERAFEEAIARAAAADPWLAEHPPEVEWWGGRFDPAVTDPADPIVTVVTGAAADVTGSAPPVEGVTYGADMRLLVNVGAHPDGALRPRRRARRAHARRVRPDRGAPRGRRSARPRRAALLRRRRVAGRADSTRPPAARRYVEETPWLSPSASI